jgi:hypothetical protein
MARLIERLFHRKPRQARQFRIPNESKISQNEINRESVYQSMGVWRTEPGARQAISPSPEGLSKNLGIKPGSTINFFAAGYGDWARALANDNKVHYSDLDIGLVGKYGRDKRFVSGLMIDGSSRPRIRGQFDWSVSFEPIPMHKIGLTMSLVRSLINNRGAKIIYGSMDHRERLGWLDETLGRLKSAYGFEHDRTVKTVEDVGLKKQQEIEVITVLTNPKTRGKAWTDLSVLEIASKLGERPQDIELKELQKELYHRGIDISKRGLIQSLERLEEIGKLCEREEHTIKVRAKRAFKKT